MSLENKLLRHFSWDVNETHWSSSSIGIYSMILWSKNLVPWILKGEYIPPVRLLICNKDRPVPFKLNFKSKYQLSSVMSDSLRPYGVQHTRPPCLSPTPGACSKLMPIVSDAIQPACRVQIEDEKKLKQPFYTFSSRDVKAGELDEYGLGDSTADFLCALTFWPWQEALNIPAPSYPQSCMLSDKCFGYQLLVILSCP